jgi:cytochrome c oxidase cbb3-type subunit III
MVVALTAFAYPCAGQPRPLKDATPADIVAGREIFEAQCALCHGAGGSGGSGPDLRRPRLFRATNDQELTAVIRNGISGTAMPFALFSLSDSMIWQTAAYVRSLGQAAREPIAGNAQRGASLYEGNGCGACHTVRGAGGVLGPDLSLIGAQRGTASLRQSLIDPGAEHAPSYRVVRAVLKSGLEMRGIPVDEDVFWINIRDVSGRVHTLSKATLVTLEREPKGTLMPSYRTLGEIDRDDLVAYLATLGSER